MRERAAKPSRRDGTESKRFWFFFLPYLLMHTRTQSEAIILSIRQIGGKRKGHKNNREREKYICTLTRDGTDDDRVRMANAACFFYVYENNLTTIE